MKLSFVSFITKQVKVVYETRCQYKVCTYNENVVVESFRKMRVYVFYGGLENSRDVGIVLF